MPIATRRNLVNPFGLLPYPGAGCVLWCPGQDDAYSATIRDRSGKGNNGTIYGATWTRIGTGLWVLNFDGTDDYILVSANNFFDTIPANGSVEQWVYLPSGYGAGSGAQTIFAKNNRETAPIQAMALDFNNTTGALDWRFEVDSVAIKASTSKTTWAAGWYHIVVEWGSGGMAILVNGAVDGTNANTTRPGAGTTRDFILGCNNWAGVLANELTGRMALQRAYSSALSVAEAFQHYSQERALFRV